MITETDAHRSRNYACLRNRANNFDSLLKDETYCYQMAFYVMQFEKKIVCVF